MPTVNILGLQMPLFLFILIILYLIALVVFIIGVWVFWKKPFMQNLTNKIKLFFYGKKGITVNMLDYQNRLHEVVGKIIDSDTFMVDHERYIIVPEASVRKVYTNKEGQITTLKYENEGKLLSSKDVGKYEIDKNLTIKENYNQHFIFTYIKGYSMPIKFDIPEHVKKHITAEGKYVVTADLFQKYMKKKIFVDKTEDDQLKKQIATMNMMQILTIGAVVVVGGIIVFKMFTG